jgi:hypothetical protein
MAGQVNISGTWKTINGIQLNVGGIWKTVTNGQVNIGGVWKPWYTSKNPDIIDYWPLTTNSIGMVNGYAGTDSEVTYGSGYVTMGTTSQITLFNKWTPITNTFTISWFIYPTTLYQYGQQMACTSGTTAPTWGVFLFHGGPTETITQAYCGTDINTRFSPTQLVTGTQVLNNWTNFTYTHDGTNGRLYKNGTLIAGPTAQNKTWFNGASFNSTDPVYPTVGRLRDIRIDNVCWTSTQVTTYYNTPGIW